MIKFLMDLNSLCYWAWEDAKTVIEYVIMYLHDYWNI